MNPRKRALLIGVQTPLDAALPARPGTCAAVRRLAALLAGDESWEVVALLDDEASDDRRPLLANVLGRLKWLADAPEGLLLLSGAARGDWFLPRDARLDLLSRTALRADEIAAHLPPAGGVVLDAPLPHDAFARAAWVLADGGRGRLLEALTRAFQSAADLSPDSLGAAAGGLTRGGGATPFWRAGRAAEACPACGRAVGASDAAFCPACGASLRSPEQLDGGRYRLLRPLGAGGMGQVFLAEDTRLRTRRAIKLLSLPPEVPAEEKIQLRQRLIQEAKAAQALGERTHHVVRVFDVGWSPERDEPFLVMELLEGCTLGRRLAEGPLPPAEAIALALTIAETLGAAHAEGMVHRDLKPDNVMLVRRGDDAAFVKVLDFGLVKMSEADVRTQSGRMMGTLQYMPPEQLRGRPVDARADVFALGAVLYECLAGVRANPGKTPGEIFHVLLDGGVRPLRALAPHLPEPLLDLVDRCLALDPDERPADGAAVAQALRAMPSPSAAPPAEAPLPDAPTVDSAPVVRDAAGAPPVSLARGEVTAPPSLAPSRSRAPLVAATLAVVAGVGLYLLWPEAKVATAEVPPSLPTAAASAPPPVAREPPPVVRTPAAESAPAPFAPPADPLPAKPAATARREGDLRVWRGATELDRWAALVLDVTLSTADPADNEEGSDREALARWAEAPPAVRAWLAARVPVAAVTRPAADALALPVPALAEVRAKRPHRLAIPGVGTLLAAPDGAPIFMTVNCGSARGSDRLVTLRWSIRGYDAGACEGAACAGVMARALRSGRDVGEAVHVELVLQRGEGARAEARCRVPAGGPAGPR